MKDVCRNLKARDYCFDSRLPYKIRDKQRHCASVWLQRKWYSYIANQSLKEQLSSLRQKMNNRLAAFRCLALCVLLAASSPTTAEAAEEYVCFPPDSMFDGIDCTCDGPSSDNLVLDCSTNEYLVEFPVLNSTYPGVTAM